MKPPDLWGTEERLRELFGEGITELSVRRREVNFRFRSAEHWFEFFRTDFGPVKMAFERLDEAAREALAADARAGRARALQPRGERSWLPASTWRSWRPELE